MRLAKRPYSTETLGSLRCQQPPGRGDRVGMVWQLIVSRRQVSTPGRRRVDVRGRGVIDDFLRSALYEGRQRRPVEPFRCRVVEQN